MDIKETEWLKSSVSEGRHLYHIEDTAIKFGVPKNADKWLPEVCQFIGKDSAPWSQIFSQLIR